MNIRGDLKVSLLTVDFELHGKERMCEECNDLFSVGDKIIGFIESVYDENSSVKLSDKVYFVHLKGKEKGSCFEDFVARFMSNKGLKVDNNPIMQKQENLLTKAP